ncbi:MAG: cation-transporting P-type ATPase [Betaproteobacteria bacterium]|nr:cation-transporting P-type ATPase [Betaproteobacteria bacterium]
MTSPTAPGPQAVAGDAGIAWHAAPGSEALAHFATSRKGLSEGEARARLAQHGPNRLRPPERRGALARFALQFHNVLIYVLLGSAAITAGLGHWVDTGVILGVVLINAAIGFVQEGKAEKALDAIRGMLSVHATVLRGGRRLEIAAEDLVPGDMVLLASGDRVPADLRLTELRSLRVDEAALTGESAPVEKSVDAVPPDAPIGDRFSLAFSGTLVTYGQGSGVVVATAGHTEIGRISALLESVEELSTPLLRQMALFGRWLTFAILALAGLAFVFGVAVRSYSIADMFLAAVGLAVAAIPEGLPAIMTITLAIGVQRMAGRNAIIRRLPAVETLGSVTVICTDKTGTLTRNEMTVQRVATAERDFGVGGAGYAPQGGFLLEDRDAPLDEHPELLEVGRAALLCNDAALRENDGEWTLEGDPTEGALVALAMKAGLDLAFEAEALPRTDVIPFESEHRFMATLHHDHAGHGFIFVKGAPERVLEMCAAERASGEDRPLDRGRWHARMDRIAAAGQRVLAVAMRRVSERHRTLRFSDVEGGFTLLALLGLADPLREEAVASIERCRAAGIRVKMITGDHAATAAAIGAQLGLDGRGGALSGIELEKMDDAALAKSARETDIFARASPEHKLRLVKALQAGGEIVAMTGDGVNDSPALKRADVGVAMGRKGTEAAKEASEMVLADDNFASITAAVEEGRTVYDNLRKAIVYILPTNGGEAGIVLIAILAGIALPITPVQILWVNMVTAVTLSLAFAFERPEAGVMRRPPRDPREPLVSGFLLWRIVLVSMIMVAGSLGLFLWESARGLPLEAARTIAVNTLVMGEIAYLFNCRHLADTALTREGFLGNRTALLAIALLALMQLGFTYAPPMQRLFGTAALDAEAWGRIALFGAALFAIVETEKRLLRNANRT